MPSNFAPTIPVLTYDTNGHMVTTFPIPVIFDRDPNATDIDYTQGQVWINEAVPTIWMLATVINGVADWLQISN
jgi:hypothetical protein